MRKKPETLALSSLNSLTIKARGAIVDLYYFMIRKLALVSVWLLVTPTLLISLGVLITIEKAKVNLPSVSASFEARVPEGESNNIQGEVIVTKINDTRPFIVEKFLKGTPLAPHSKYMVEVADKYDIDYRLIPAIAMKESGAGTAVTETSHNAWGFENGRTQFSSWETAIETVGKTLKKRYIAKGMTTPDEIMPVYAPPQMETGGKWAKDINYFYTQMETL